MRGTQQLAWVSCVCVFVCASLVSGGRLNLDGEQSEQTLRDLAVKSADELRERIRDFKVELDEVNDDFRRTNDSCNALIDQRLTPCFDCMATSCKTALTSLCNSADSVRNTMARLQGVMRDDWKMEQTVASLNRQEIVYYYDLISSVASAITRSSLGQAITSLGERGMAVVRGFDGLSQYYVPAQSSQQRKSLYTKMKEGLSKAWSKFKDAFKPRGCSELERSATRLCVQESINLKLKCSQCNQQVDPRIHCPHFEESLSQLLQASEKAQALNSYLVGNRNTISFKLQSVTITENDDDRLEIKASVILQSENMDVQLELTGSRYKRNEAALIKKISDAIAEKVLDFVML